MKSTVEERARIDRLMYDFGLVFWLILVLTGHYPESGILLILNYWGWRATWESRR